VLITLGCTITGTQDTGLQETRIAMEAQMTIMAGQSGQNQQLTAVAEQANQVAQSAQATLMAQQATQLAQQATQLAGAQPPSGDQTVAETQPVQATEPPPVVTESSMSDAELDAKIKNAKILLYEDMAGRKVYNFYPTRYIKEALDMGGYSYKDDGSAMGWYKEDLLSSNQWDLIISASEYHDAISGEYFEYLLPHINRGAGVIIEMFYVDDVVNGKIAPILAKCGVGLYADWPNPDTLAMWPLVPDDPLFSYPNKGISMRKTARFWDFEHGDLLKLTGSGDATLLLGTIATNKSDHGTLTRCNGGRLLIQTYCTHDFDQGTVELMWENMIYNTLKNKFLAEQ
jgi:hypothetical protein